MPPAGLSVADRLHHVLEHFGIQRRYRKFKPPFFWPEQYRRTGEMSISFLFDKIPDFASAGLGGATVGGARFVRYRAARSHAQRAAPSVAFSSRFRLSDRLE
jgi:hypothetical protein